MLRLLFQKTDRAVWISHLDLMRLFQRAFKRAGLPLTHTQGFNPRPSVSIALPLSVGVESQCELLDFELEGADVCCEEICRKLNTALIDGIIVKEVYAGGRKLRDLVYLQCNVILSYDKHLPADAVDDFKKLFGSEKLPVLKKTKNGMQEQDIIPMIKKIVISAPKDNEIVMDAIICCQNPTLNPMQLVAAVEHYLPQLRPDQVLCRRQEVLDSDFSTFR